MKNKFNIKGVIYGILVLAMVVGGFVFIPSMFSDNSSPVDYNIVQREEIPEKILGVMDKYVDQERALALKLDGKVYIIVTRGNDNEHGIQINKVTTSEVEDKNVMKVEVKYMDKDKSHPYVVAETNLTDLPDRIELNAVSDNK